MRFEPDLFKEILVFCEDHLPNDNKNYRAQSLEFDNYTKDQIVFHVKLLFDNGFIEAIDGSTQNFSDYVVRNLTLRGYTLLDMMRNDTIGKKVVTFLKQAGVAAIPLVLEYSFNQVVGMLSRATP